MVNFLFEGKEVHIEGYTPEDKRHIEGYTPEDKK